MEVGTTLLPRRSYVPIVPTYRRYLAHIIVWLYCPELQCAPNCRPPRLLGWLSQTFFRLWEIYLKHLEPESLVFFSKIATSEISEDRNRTFKLFTALNLNLIAGLDQCTSLVYVMFRTELYTIIIQFNQCFQRWDHKLAFAVYIPVVILANESRHVTKLFCNLCIHIIIKS